MPDKDYLKRFGKTVLPVVANEGLWSMGTSMYSVFYGRLGDAAVAAVGIVNTVDQLIFTMIYGLLGLGIVSLSLGIIAKEALALQKQRKKQRRTKQK